VAELQRVAELMELGSHGRIDNLFVHALPFLDMER
jgi:hypothetical protein